MQGFAVNTFWHIYNACLKTYFFQLYPPNISYDAKCVIPIYRITIATLTRCKNRRIILTSFLHAPLLHDSTINSVSLGLCMLCGIWFMANKALKYCSVKGQCHVSAFIFIRLLVRFLTRSRSVQDGLKRRALLTPLVSAFLRYRSVIGRIHGAIVAATIAVTIVPCKGDALLMWIGWKSREVKWPSNVYTLPSPAMGHWGTCPSRLLTV